MSDTSFFGSLGHLGSPFWRHLFDTSSAGEFLQRFTDLYLDSFLTNVVVGVLLGALGLFVILRRMVFLSAALSQVAGTGLALAFFLGAVVAHQSDHLEPAPVARPGELLDRHEPTGDVEEEIQSFLENSDASALDPEVSGIPGAGARGVAPGHRSLDRVPLGPTKQTGSTPPTITSGEVPDRHRHGRHEPISPMVLSLLITVGVALLLSGMGGGKWRSTRESVVGLVFIVASAASIILAQLAEKGAHEIAELLFGTVIFIPPDQQRLVYVTALVSLAAYGLLLKDFVFVSFDPIAARAGHYPVWLTNASLFVLIAVSIAICTRAVGAMPVFALTVLPPAAALQIHDRLGPAVITSAILGAIAAAGGYFLSGLLNLSAGPLIVLVAALGVGVTSACRLSLTHLRSRRARRQGESGKVSST